VKKEDRKFGKAQGEPPSFFARVPTGVIWNARRYGQRHNKRGLSLSDFHIFTVLCSYANGQGFAWPNSATIAELCATERSNVTRALTKAEKLGYIEKVSRFRSHPQWRHVMGTVWRIVYDARLDQAELIDSMNKEDPPPVVEEDLPTTETPPVETGKHEVEVDDDELVRVAFFHATAFCRAAEAATGEVRVVTPRAIEAALAALKGGYTTDTIKAAMDARLKECRDTRKSAPHHLGWLSF
jgi:hypothetical protein